MSEKPVKESETERQQGEFCDSGKSLCSYAEAYFGAGTKLTVLGKKRGRRNVSQSTFI